MVRSLTVGFALVAVVALAGVAKAQPGGGGAGRGAGMFGGGFGGGFGMSYAMLLRSEKVQKEIEFVEDQKAKLKEVSDKAQAKMRENRPQGNFQDMTDEQRQDMRKKMEAITAEQKKAIEEILLPNQLERLKQIALQLRGTQALNDKETQEALGMTDDQKAKLKTIGEEIGTKMRELFSPDADRATAREKMQTLQKDSQEKMLGVLTGEQKEKLEKLKGPKCDITMADLFQGGPGGQRGGNRGGNRGAGN